MTAVDRGVEMRSVRWAFRCGSWTPSRSDWLFAARCVQKEEKERIAQFMFAKDAKSAMVSLTANFVSLLLRHFEIPYRLCRPTGWQVAAEEVRL